MTPEDVEQWCDNETSVNHSETRPKTPSAMIAPDADIVLAIHHLKSTIKYKTRCRHVYGHQDSSKGKKKKSKKDEREKQREQDTMEQATSSDSSTSVESAIDATFGIKPIPPPTENSPAKGWKKGETPKEVLINIACDEIATDTTAAALENDVTNEGGTLEPPYEGSRAMLRIGKEWITSKYKQAIYSARHTPPIREYCCRRFDWDDSTFDAVHWETVGTVRRKLTRTKRMQSMKVMHGWLPIMHMRQFVTGVKQCPGCTCDDETMDHLFQCPHPRMKETRANALQVLKKAGKTNKIPSTVMTAVCHVLRTESDQSGNFHQRNHSKHISAAIDDQLAIGTSLLQRGYISSKWREAIKEAGSKHPDRRMTALLRLIWDHWTDPIWKTRNEILHGPSSKYMFAEDKHLSEQIAWYTRNKAEVLAYQDHFVAELDMNRLHSMGRKTKKRLLGTLDKLRKRHQIERDQRLDNQRTILRCFGLANKDPTKEGVT